MDHRSSIVHDTVLRAQRSRPSPPGRKKSHEDKIHTRNVNHGEVVTAHELDICGFPFGSFVRVTGPTDETIPALSTGIWRVWIEVGANESAE